MVNIHQRVKTGVTGFWGRLGGHFDCSLVPPQTRKRATAKEKEKEKLEKSLGSIEHVRFRTIVGLCMVAL